MLRAAGVADVRAAEERAAAECGWDALMQRAATGLAELLSDVAAGTSVAFLIGPGNNGGDALFAAAHLQRRGVSARLCLLEADRVHAEGLAAAREAGAQVVEEPSDEPVWVDGLFGIGARGGLRGAAAAWAAQAAERRPHVVAVDVPSGIGVDDGTVDGPVIAATRTVTFGALKVGLLAGPAAAYAGEISLIDIGLDLFGGEGRGVDLSRPRSSAPQGSTVGSGSSAPQGSTVGPRSSAPDALEPMLEAIDAMDGALLDPVVPGTAAHKYTRGVLGIAAGSAAYAGAAHLCVAGAQAGPAGMIRIVGDPDLTARVVDRAPEVVAQPGRVQAWVVGPGGGPDAGDRLAEACSDDVPVVVDAEALRHLGDRRGGALVLTPHAGELARMLDVERDAVEADPWSCVHRAAERWEATVLLKGPRTLVATPGRTTRVNLSGTPWLATAGAGDVLAGFCGSLLAAGLDPHDAASVAAYLHGIAAERASEGGPIVARHVAAFLPQAFADFRVGGAA